MQEHCVPAEEELRLMLSMARSGSSDARRALMEGCLPLVVAWTAPLRGQDMPFARMIEAGNLAMMEALRGPGLDPSQDLIPQLRLAVEQSLSRALNSKI
jgi:DNA-directed RNA polymerase specialized sigma subunit